MNQQTIGYLVAFIVIALVMGLRIWRGSRARKLQVERMWIRPVIVCTILGLSIISQPPPMTPLILGSLAAVTALGVLMGWYRGRMVRVSIDPVTHALTSKASPWGMLIFLALMVVRVGARVVLGHEHDVMGGAGGGGDRWPDAAVCGECGGRAGGSVAAREAPARGRDGGEGEG